MDFYKKLPQNASLKKKHGKQQPILDHLSSNLPDKHLGLTGIEVKAHVLDSVRKKWTKPASSRGRNALTVRDRRQLKVFDVPKDGHKFENYIPMNELWQDYMRDILDLKRYDSTDPRQTQQNNERLLKADFHGCHLVVRRSRCPSLVGQAGIVVMETKNMLKIVGKDDKLKSIPKMNSVFVFKLDGFLFTVHGNNFCVNAYQRSKRKFKQKASVEL